MKTFFRRLYDVFVSAGSDDKQLCKTFSNFFQEVVKTLGVSDNLNMSNYSHRDLVYNAL